MSFFESLNIEFSSFEFSKTFTPINDICCYIYCNHEELIHIIPLKKLPENFEFFQENNKKSLITFEFKYISTNILIGSVSTSIESLIEKSNSQKKSIWLTLFEPEDDLYDGNFQEDDLEYPRVLLSFSLKKQEILTKEFDLEKIQANYYETIKNSQNVLSEIKGRILNDKLQRKEEGVLSEKINEIHDQIMNQQRVVTEQQNLISKINQENFDLKIKNKELIEFLRKQSAENGHDSMKSEIINLETLAIALNEFQNIIENFIETNSHSTKECFLQNTHLLKVYTSIREELDLEKQINEDLKKKNLELKEEYANLYREKEEHIFQLNNELKEIKIKNKELEILCEHLQKNMEILKMPQASNPKKNFDNSNERRQNPLRNITNEEKSFHQYNHVNQNDLVKINKILEENYESSNQIAKHLINDLDLFCQKFSFDYNGNERSSLSTQAMEFETKNKEFELFEEIQRLFEINEELNISNKILLKQINEKNQIEGNETIETNKMAFFNTVLSDYFRLKENYAQLEEKNLSLFQEISYLKKDKNFPERFDSKQRLNNLNLFEKDNIDFNEKEEYYDDEKDFFYSNEKGPISPEFALCKKIELQNI